MHSWRRLARSIVLPLVLTAPAWTQVGSARKAAGSPRLISFERLPEPDAAMCELEPTLDTDVAALHAFQRSASGQGAGASDEGERSGVAARKPLRFIQDPYPSFSSVAVDPVRNEVVLTDENRFNILVYDRLANTPSSASHTEPKRRIGGLQTKTQYSSGLYVDPKSGDIYVVNNDTVRNLTVYSRQAQGNVEPDRELTSPYGNFGIAVDEEKQELFLTVQHDGAVMVYPKMARGDERAVRLLQGDRTRLGDPHGIALDPKNKLIFVANYGTTRQAVQGTVGQSGSPRIPNWPAGNLGFYRREVVLGTGKFRPPSITVFPSDAHGNIAPLRTIEGPKAQLKWPTGVAFDPERGELYVANAAGDSVAVFNASAQGDVAPIRVLKGSRTFLKNPTGVFVDVANDEVWVANFGNHMATVYKRTASGDAAPSRVIRSAPLDAETTMLSNPFQVAYDSTREEILVPN